MVGVNLVIYTYALKKKIAVYAWKTKECGVSWSANINYTSRVGNKLLEIDAHCVGLNQKNQKIG